MSGQSRPFAVITGASTGIGYYLARECAEQGFDLLVAADEPEIHAAAETFSLAGVAVQSLDVNLATIDGVDRLCEAIDRRPVDALIANAGRGLGQAFLDQDFLQVRHVIETNVTGTVYLIQKVARNMRERRNGRILIVGSIAGFMPGPFHAVYNATKAFLNSFSFALRNELLDSGISVTCLMPGATDTKFFERAGLLDTEIGQSEKDDPADIARVGFAAMMDGEGDVVSGWKNKLQAALANVTSAERLAEKHRKLTEPHTAGE